MNKCANCTLDAVFAYQVTGSYLIYYCSKHTPKFLSGTRYAGRLVKVSSIPAPVALVVEEPVIEEVSAPKPSRKKSAPVAEPTDVEETVVVEEPTVVEEAPVIEDVAPSEE